MFTFGSRKRVSSSSYHFVTTTPRALNTTTVATRLTRDGPHLAAHRQKESATRPSCGVVAAEPIRTRLIDMHTLSKRIARRCDITSAVGQSPHFLLRLCSLGKLLVSCHPCCGTCLSARAIQTWLLFGGYPIWRAATLLGRTRTGACRSWTNGGSPVSLFLSAPCLLCGSCGSDTSCNTTQRSPRWWMPIKKKEQCIQVCNSTSRFFFFCCHAGQRTTSFQVASGFHMHDSSNR